MLLPQGRQLLSFLKKLFMRGGCGGGWWRIDPQFFRSFQRWHLFFLDLVIFAWNLWGGKEEKKLRMSHGVTYGTQYDSKTHAFKLSPMKTRILTALYIFSNICHNNTNLRLNKRLRKHVHFRVSLHICN